MAVTEGKPARSTRSAEVASTLMKSHYARGRRQEEQGGPVAWCMRGVPDEILFSMDIYPAYPENYGTVCASRQKAVPFMEVAEADGFSHDICGYLRVALGYAKLMMSPGGIPNDAPLGGMPRPTMFLAPSRMCDPRVKLFESLRRYVGVPACIFDIMCPPIDDADCFQADAQSHYIEYNVASVRGLVRFLEEQVGKSIDQERLAHAVANSMEVWRLFYDINQLRRTIPCPVPTEDAFSIFFPAMWMGGTDEAVEFFRNMHSEVTERVEAGRGVIQDEKHRILWVGLTPYFDMGLFNYLESKGAVSVVETTFFPARPIDIDPSDPIRALVEKQFWGFDLGGSDGSQIRCGGLGGGQVLKMAADYRVDGAIIYASRSCRAVSIGSRNMARLLRENLGLPVVYIEADMTDPRDYSHSQVRGQVDAFVELLDMRKKS